MAVLVVCIHNYDIDVEWMSYNQRFCNNDKIAIIQTRYIKWPVRLECNRINDIGPVPVTFEKSFKKRIIIIIENNSH